MAKDFALGVISLAFALFYVRAASLLPDSLLSDRVGPWGFPLILGWALAGVGALLIVRGLARSAAPQPAASGSPIVDDPLPTAARAFAIVIAAIGFLFLLPIVGYMAAVTLFVLILALYLGIRPGWQPVAVSVSGAAVLWAIFAWLLGIRLPSGFWSRLF